MNRSPLFAKRRERLAQASVRKVGTHARMWFWDSVADVFYQKTIPDYSVPGAEFSQRFYLHDDPAHSDPAAVIRSIPQAEVHGRVFDQPDNPANIIERDGRKYVNVREKYYDALNARHDKQAA